MAYESYGTLTTKERRFMLRADLDEILSKPLTLGSERRALELLKMLGVQSLKGAK